MAMPCWLERDGCGICFVHRKVTALRFAFEHGGRAQLVQLLELLKMIVVGTGKIGRSVGGY